MAYNLKTQQIFDKVVTHLYTQKRQAMSSDNICKYRADNGLSCAVGCLIEDKDYQKEFDDADNDNGTAIEDIITNIDFKNKKLKMFLEKNVDILERLQTIHDRNANWDSSGPSIDMSIKLQELAADFNLNLNILKKFVGE